MAPENKQQDLQLETAAENLHLLEKEYKEVQEKGELFPGELKSMEDSLHGLKVHLGLEIELTPEQREEYSRKLMDSTTPDHEVTEIADIARRAAPPSNQP